MTEIQEQIGSVLQSKHLVEDPSVEVVETEVDQVKEITDTKLSLS